MSLDMSVCEDSESAASDEALSGSRQDSNVGENSWVRKVFSFPVVLAALLVVLTVLTVRGRFSDPDMWWHLKTGEIIWNTHSISRVDVFSYTTNHHPYVPHEWLSQLTIYAAYYFGDYSGLMLWLCVFASLIVVGGYVLCWVYSGNPKVAFLGAMGIWLFSTVGLAIRPQLIGYLLLICELLILELGRTRSPKWFFVLPPLFAVWVNCHGSFLLGMIVLAAVLVSAVCDFRIGLVTSDRWSTRRLKALAGAFSFSAAALFVNPTGLDPIRYSLSVMFSLPLNTHFVSEWQPISFDDIRAWGLFGIAALTLLVPLFRRTGLTLQDLAFVAFGFALAVQHQRMLFVFGLLVMPVVCRALATTWDDYDPRRNSVLVNAGILALAIFPIPLAFPRSTYLMEQVNKANPVAAVKFIKRSGVSGRMLNDYVYGGYLIWAAPGKRVFVDGRGDVFEWTGVLSDYLKFSNAEVDPRVILNKYRIDFCVLPSRASISTVMRLLPGWKSVYSDGMSVVFVRSPVANAKVISK